MDHVQLDRNNLEQVQNSSHLNGQDSDQLQNNGNPLDRSDDQNQIPILPLEPVVAMEKKPDKKVRAAISLETKYNVIKDVNKGLSYKEICHKYDLKMASNVSSIIKNKKKIMDAINNQKGLTSSTKKIRQANYKDVDEVMYKWLENINNRNIPVSGPQIKKKAEQIGKDLGFGNFKASNGWLHRFKQRYNTKQEDSFVKIEEEEEEEDEQEDEEEYDETNRTVVSPSTEEAINAIKTLRDYICSQNFSNDYLTYLKTIETDILTQEYVSQHKSKSNDVTCVIFL